MKHYLKPIIALAVLALLGTTNLQAGTEEIMVIALKTGDFEMTETDISDLAIGESQTIETDSGKIIDLLRTADGVEIYVDGELLDINSNSDGLHERHLVRKHVEVICDDNEECDKNVFILAGDDTDGEFLLSEEILLSCSDESDSGCSEKMVWISDGEEVDMAKLHELHEMNMGDSDHEMIIIKRKVIRED